MFDKYYVPVESGIVQRAAEHFLQEVTNNRVNLEVVLLRQMMTFCKEAVMIAEQRNTTFTMTNTQAVWVYTWEQLAKDAMEPYKIDPNEGDC